MAGNLPDNSPRIPEPVSGIQVNCCKNPKCLNFGKPELPVDVKPGPRLTLAKGNLYTIVGGGKDYPLIRCGRCGESPPIKSNLAVVEELERISRYLSPEDEPSCPDEKCPNHSVKISAGRKFYQSFGKTHSGSARYRCKACMKTFSVGKKSTLKQKLPHKNKILFKEIVNKSPIQRTLEILEIGAGTYYGKLEFFHKQALAFLAHRENKMISGEVSIPRLYLGVDRQDYTINWVNANLKRNIILSAIGCADNRTGYMFGMHLNYDPDCNHVEVNKETFRNGDYLAKPPFRRYARLWISKDYQDSGDINPNRKVAEKKGLLVEDIRATYEDIESRTDTDNSELFLKGNMRLPNIGMQVHSEYTMYGYFLFLKKLFKHVGKVRFFLDQESGIRAACFYAFQDEILARTCDAFYVKINKELTINERRKLGYEAQKRLDELSEKYGIPDIDLRIELLREEMRNPVKVGKELWVRHPIPGGSEPEKFMCYLTDQGDYDEIHLARLYDKASLHAIDRFMMLTRRRISLLERPISSASNAARRWHGYSPYNPRYISMLLDILRVYYNYVMVGDDKQTPAMRLGLAKGKIDVEEIIRFKP